MISGQLFWCLTNSIVYIFSPLYLIRVSLAAVVTAALGSGRPNLDFSYLPFPGSVSFSSGCVLQDSNHLGQSPLNSFQFVDVV